MMCPHGKPLAECEICWSELKRFHEARKAGDWQKMEQLSAEMRRDHKQQNRQKGAQNGIAN